MPLTPLEIHNKEFRKAFRGYDEEEVDEFLDRLVKDYEKLYKENLDLRESLAAKDSNIGQYKDLEDTLKKTLIVAQQTADDLKSAAARESEVIIKEAQLKAEQVIALAEEKAKALLREYEDIQKETQKFKSKLRSFLLSQLDLLGNEESVISEQTKLNVVGSA